jgi:transposase
MEQILYLYALPYDAEYPVVCFDERPCFLIGEVVQGLAMQPGKPAREHYVYTKNGSACVLAAIEPLTGKRLAHVRRQRGYREFTRFIQQLDQLYPQAKRIRLVLDNLNIHCFAAFYKCLPAEQAQALAQRFEFYYTPKGASWLNMIEIEFSALSRQCLKKRIPNINQLATQVLTYFKERSDKQIKINWQFTVSDARHKFQRHYEKVNPSNSNY